MRPHRPCPPAPHRPLAPSPRAARRGGRWPVSLSAVPAREVVGRSGPDRHAARHAARHGWATPPATPTPPATAHAARRLAASGFCSVQVCINTDLRRAAPRTVNCRYWFMTSSQVPSTEMGSGIACPQALCARTRTWAPTWSHLVWPSLIERKAGYPYPDAALIGATRGARGVALTCNESHFYMFIYFEQCKFIQSLMQKNYICAPCHGKCGHSWFKIFKPDFENALKQKKDNFSTLHQHLKGTDFGAGWSPCTSIYCGCKRGTACT